MILLFLLSGGYLLHSPVSGAFGGSWLGIVYGILATLGMVILMWFGVRKRSYFSSTDSLKGWLAFHIWLGVSLLLLVPLHSGFHFGINIHTGAYVLIVLTVVTGIWGAINYVRLASTISSHRGGARPVEIIQQLELLQKEMDILCKDKGDTFQQLYTEIDFEHIPGIRRAVFSKLPDQLDSTQISQWLEKLPLDEREEALDLIGKLHRKLELCRQIQHEVRVDFKLKIWLFFHIPLACAAMLAVVIHIFVVFYYW